MSWGRLEEGTSSISSYMCKADSEKPNQARRWLRCILRPRPALKAAKAAAYLHRGLQQLAPPLAVLQQQCHQGGAYPLLQGPSCAASSMLPAQQAR